MPRDGKKTKKQLIEELDELRRQVVDTSGQKDTQTNFLSDSKRYQRAEEIAQVGSFVVNVTTGKMKWSDQVYRLLGSEPGEIEPDNESFSLKLNQSKFVNLPSMAGISPVNSLPCKYNAVKFVN